MGGVCGGRLGEKVWRGRFCEKNLGGGSEILRKNSRGVSQISRDIRHQVICTKVPKKPLNSHITTL